MATQDFTTPALSSNFPPQANVDHLSADTQAEVIGILAQMRQAQDALMDSKLSKKQKKFLGQMMALRLSLRKLLPLGEEGTAKTEAVATQPSA